MALPMWRNVNAVFHNAPSVNQYMCSLSCVCKTALISSSFARGTLLLSCEADNTLYVSEAALLDQLPCWTSSR